MCEQKQRQKLFVWHRYGLPDHTPIGTRLPVLENTVTQIATGPYICGATIVSNGEVTAAHALVKPQSIGRMLFKPGFTGFYVPLRWAGDLKYNGVMATPTAIHMPVEKVSYHIRGGEREMVGCILSRMRLVETVAALRGVDPDPLALYEGALELAPKASSHVRGDTAPRALASYRSPAHPASRRPTRNAPSNALPGPSRTIVEARSRAGARTRSADDKHTRSPSSRPFTTRDRQRAAGQRKI